MRNKQLPVVPQSDTTLTKDDFSDLFEQRLQQPETWKPVREDFNLCRLPYFIASDKKTDRFRDLEHKYQISKDGKSLEALWEVRHDSKLGLPGSFDRDVWLGILEIINETTEGGRKPLPEVIELGSSREFLKRIGKRGSGGRDVDMLRRSVERLATTGCISKGSFNCPTDGGYLYLGEVFHLIRSWAFKGEIKPDGGVYETTWIKLDPFLQKNLNSGYINLIDAKYIRKLRTDIAKLLYPLLSYRFWQAAKNGRNSWMVHWQELANYLGITSWHALWRAKAEFKRAVTELKLHDYIDDSSDWEDECYVFMAGAKFIDELAQRLSARNEFRSWVQGNQNSKLPQQLSIPGVVPQTVEPTPDDERQIALVRSATRLLLGMSIDEALLSVHGLSRKDAESVAEQQRKRLRSIG